MLAQNFLEIGLDVELLLSSFLFFSADLVFLGQVHLQSGSISSIAERMQDYQVIAMVLLLGLVTSVYIDTLHLFFSFVLLLWYSIIYFF